jgi:hypothetical protein
MLNRAARPFIPAKAGTHDRDWTPAFAGEH